MLPDNSILKYTKLIAKDFDLKHLFSKRQN